MNHTLKLVYALLCFSLIGCGGAEPEETEPPTVIDDGCANLCGDGTVCKDGSCVAIDSNMTTPPNNTTPNNASAGSAVGEACVQGEDCATDLCLSDASIPQGYCSKVCATGLPGADDRCPAGSACTSLEGGSSICFKTCASRDECRDGYACVDNGAQKICVPACRVDDDCSLDTICDVPSGTCVAPPAGETRVGGSCEADTDCATQVCFDEAQTDWPAGACVGDCDAPDGDFCDGADPSSGLCLALDDGNICLPSCRSGVDCREGYACSADVAAANDQGYGFCIPSCEVFGCDVGEYCDVTGFCEVSGGEDAYVETTSLGFHTLDGEHISDEIQFDIPDDAISFTLTIEPPLTDYEILHLFGPNDELLYDYDNPIASKIKYQSSTTLTYPNSPSLNVTGGTHGATIYSYVPSEVEVILHIKRGSPPVEGNLPLTLWFTNNGYMNAEVAQTDPDFQAAVAQMQDIYLSAGITLEPVTYVDLVEPAASEYSVVDETIYTETDVLVGALGGEQLVGANIVFVEQYLLEDGGSLYGVSAGLPGPPAVNTSAALGVIVALDIHYVDSWIDVGELASTMGHELGHYLGLYHLSESDGSSHDPLSDTPECDLSFDGDGDESLSASECGEAVGRHMMFWTSADGAYTQDHISPAQGWVMQRNPAVSH